MVMVVMPGSVAVRFKHLAALALVVARAQHRLPALALVVRQRLPALAQHLPSLALIVRQRLPALAALALALVAVRVRHRLVHLQPIWMQLQPPTTQLLQEVLQQLLSKPRQPRESHRRQP